MVENAWMTMIRNMFAAFQLKTQENNFDFLRQVWCWILAWTCRPPASEENQMWGRFDKTLLIYKMTITE